jgi:hypothetical protein
MVLMIECEFRFFRQEQVSIFFDALMDWVTAQNFLSLFVGGTDAPGKTSYMYIYAIDPNESVAAGQRPTYINANTTHTRPLGDFIREHREKIEQYHVIVILEDD